MNQSYPDLGDLTAFEFGNIKPLHKNVIIELPPDTGEVLHEHKSGIVISSAFSSEESFAPSYGTVVKKSDAIDRRVKHGDTVFFHYLAYINARNTKKQVENGGYDPTKTTFTCGGKKYLIMSINEVLFVKRGDELLSINDYVLLRPIMREIESEEVQTTNGKMKVYYESSNNYVAVAGAAEAYRTDRATVISAPDGTFLYPGDTVALPKDWDVPLEKELLAILKEPVCYIDKEYCVKIRDGVPVIV